MDLKNLYSLFCMYKMKIRAEKWKKYGIKQLFLIIIQKIKKNHG